MTLNQIRYFHSVAKHQHFRRAAAEMNISQPSLSRSIKALEDELDLVLFERSGRNIRLTKYGNIFWEHATRILSEVDTAAGRMHQLSGAEGHVDIAYVFPLASHYIPHMVRRFLTKDKNKDVTFSFHQSHTAEMVKGLKAERYDVIFCSYVENEPDLQFIPIISQEMVVITPPNHPLSQKDAVSLTDLERFPIIGYDRLSGLGKYTRRIYQAHGLNPNIICESPDENAISSLVAEDFGIALVANVKQIQDRDVCILPVDETTLIHTVYLAYKKNRYMITSAKNFISFIRKEGTHL